MAFADSLASAPPSWRNVSTLHLIQMLYMYGQNRQAAELVQQLVRSAQEGGDTSTLNKAMVRLGMGRFSAYMAPIEIEWMFTL